MAGERISDTYPRQYFVFGIFVIQMPIW